MERYARNDRIPGMTNLVNGRYILSPYASSVCQMQLQVTYLDSSKDREHADISLVVQILFLQKLANFLRYISPVKTVMILVETIWKISLQLSKSPLVKSQLQVQVTRRNYGILQSVSILFAHTLVDHQTKFKTTDFQ